MDTEADSRYSYPERLCLIQITLPGTLLLIDPLAQIDLAPLWESLKNTELIIHAADYDLLLLYRRFGFVPRRLFDTMWAARLLGFRQFGLHHLVQHFHQVILEKSSRKANWGKRPLTPKMVEYALNDVRYLLSIHKLLQHRLEESGRISWLEEAGNRMLKEAVRRADAVHVDAWRLKGSNQLDASGLAFLKGLWEWREAEAHRSNKPPFFVMTHKTLIEIARLASRRKAWEMLLPRRFSHRRRHNLRATIMATRKLSPKSWPPVKRVPEITISQVEKDRLKEMEALRNARAGELGLDPTLIANRAALVALARDEQSQIAQLMAWQRRLMQA